MAAINLDTAARLDITCRKGDTFVMELDFGQLVNTTGWLMHVRETDTSEDEILIPVDDISFTVSDNDGGVTNAKLKITIPADTMAILNSGMYVYDLQNTRTSVVKTYLYGLFKVNEDVTV
jgi:hypothetical protein